ncbi:sulfur carrier protein ThiS [[Erwinia] mediterraneensis]|uniref:sulfur carrier protein ThiS n=1 Tax=[Erwinia] mediterraneensis TaxID=2161819 RepID=UPI0010315D70|nr:sulfur carrier protein ThiS [[Erwinia] mediterraneensis]
MKVRVNDEQMTLAEAVTLNELLQQLAQPPSGIALAVNQTVVPRNHWAEHTLCEGDDILIFQAIAGG